MKPGISIYFNLHLMYDYNDTITVYFLIVCFQILNLREQKLNSKRKWYH